MTNEEIEAVLAEIGSLAGHEDPQLQAVRTALLLEDAFDVTLSDDEIDPASLSDAATIRRLLARHGVRD